MNARDDASLPLPGLPEKLDPQGRTDPGTEGVIGLLFYRAVPNLTRADLRLMIGQTYEAERIAAQAAAVAKEFAFLSTFEDAEAVMSLVLHLGSTFEHVAALAHVGYRAAELLDKEGGAA